MVFNVGIVVFIGIVQPVSTCSEKDRDNDARNAAFTHEEQRKILWRVDRRLVTNLGALYCL